MRGHKSYTIYKSGLCDLRPGHTVKACNQDRARIGPGLGWAGVGPDYYCDRWYVEEKEEYMTKITFHIVLLETLAKLANQ